ncbi:MAG: DUF5684 domain-containing protein, partial [Candidatus Peregrinibacteria bacterium]|nr:DUF5684 domain-containing protein [Candidatus Peregrinibacteria bacterium]
MTYLFVSLALVLFYFFCQFMLAKRLGHSHPWFAFVPVLQVIQFFQMGKVSAWWILLLWVPIVNLIILGKACFNISERAGEHRVFGLLFFVPFVNYWAIWKLAFRKNAGGEVVEDLNERDATIVQAIKQDLLENAQVGEIKKEALLH